MCIRDSLKRDGCFKVPRAKLYTAEISLGLNHLHNLGIIYRDLKPENILIDSEGHVRLADFDLCKHTLKANGELGSEAKTFCGTPEYTAPEMILGQAKKAYQKEVDWWALGTLLYEMLTGLPPYYDKCLSTMCEMILGSPLKQHFSVPPDAFDLISRWLERDPKSRLGSGDQDFARIQAHTFFSSMGPSWWEDVLNRKVVPDFRPEHGQIYIDSEAMAIPMTSGSVQLSSSQTMTFQGFTYNKDASSFIHGSISRNVPRSPSNQSSPAQNNRSNDTSYKSSSDANEGHLLGDPALP
eukprot:TRINITY_DN652_c0_g1_i9.p1 TRINITY_DN652_c0_g1~~TRINITY_DN652_c0_g1_i9.p1  ORF type:complete len:296 (+),score=59.71 TRINITY_DN652_c0_g1_i9:139-1026(+)